MKELYSLSGIITVLNTPFTAADTLDLPGLRRNVQAALAAGVAGFLVPAMAAEVNKLSRTERRQMVETVLAEVAGRVPVFGGASAPDADTRRQILADLRALGCDHVLLQIPHQTDAQYRADVLDAAEVGFAVLMLQDWDFGGGGLPLSLIVRLFEEVDSFRCLKIETVPAGVKYSAVLAATDGRLHVSGGWAVSQMLEGLARGVHAFMPTGMHHIYTAIFNRYQAGQTEAARDLFYELLPVLAFANQHLDISIHFFKRLLWRQGIYATPRVREPILPFDAIHQQEADRLIERVMHLKL
ncbi:MAG: 4-hydroxy-tetrahydrodipicolinate synthase [Anaerolineae bacterium]|nr:4-hydroxy-tetrahydrodipicolinate synthase [Anaerolineae bacterium]